MPVEPKTNRHQQHQPSPVTQEEEDEGVKIKTLQLQSAMFANATDGKMMSVATLAGAVDLGEIIQ